MAAADIAILGAREHNLRNVDVLLPRNQLICLTGVSGSGKSSLAFDTLYAEGQRRYIESLSSFARQFLGQMPKPDVDQITGLSPAISISQKSSGQNPRSTVGTITEIYDYLRVLYARIGQGHCPKCGQPITAQTREQILGRIAALPPAAKFSVLAPLIRGQKGEYRDLFVDLLKQGFVRARVDGRVVSLSDDLRLDRQMRHNIEVVVDRLTASTANRNRVAEAVDLALKLGQGNLIVALEDKADETEAATGGATGGSSASVRKTARSRTGGQAASGARSASAASGAQITEANGSQSPSVRDIQLSAHYACIPCGLSFEPPSPQLFSFNSPVGMCRDCDGLGEVYTFDPAKLIANSGKSFMQGCFEMIGTWRDMGRWKKHIYQGVAETVERVRELEPGTLLETAWEELPAELQDLLLWGTGELHVTFTWRHGAGVHKYGGKFEGIIPEMLAKYRNSQSVMQRRQLEKYMRVLDCTKCRGERLNEQARSVLLTTQHAHFAQRPARSLPEVCSLAVSEAQEFFSELQLDATQRIIAAEVLKEVRGRLGFLTNVGLEYLTLDRKAPTLSGGESQRIRLAGQVGCGLVGVTYILDEPSIGLHARDNDRLLATLEQLRDLGNTVVVVEHDEETMRAADHIIDFGPGPGVRGGEVVASGAFDAIVRAKRSLTGQFLAGKRRIEIPARRRGCGERRLIVHGARHNNLKNVNVEIPLGAFVCITGVSGSGKSSLVNDILVEALRRDLNGGAGDPGLHDKITGLEHLDKLIAIDQSPIGRTPRSNPSTYVKVFDDIRDLYAQHPDAKARGYKPGRFSFNVAGGRCEACEGNGSNRLEMDFLADVWVTCPVCGGHRFNRETLQIKFKGKSISDVLEMDIQQALEHFANVPHVQHKLQTLHDVGLDYLKLGQPSPTLSGGEAQRVKLARELVKKSTGRTLYLLDEPTTGLHFADIEMLLKVLHDFVEQGNTVLVVEHNLDVIKTADWLIDLGPEGGDGGGRIIAAGTPEELANVKDSYTGVVLRKLLRTNGQAGKNGSRGNGAARKRVPKPPAKVIRVQGARQHNLKGIDVEVQRDRLTVCCGRSGSGKSSLAMDTIYAEGQRRYVESLSAYARQFVGQMQKPQLEHIEGLSPAIAIEQKHLGHTPRSTVGTVTEVYDYLRILFARLGTPYCPDCEQPIGTQTADEIIDKIVAEPPDTRLYLMAPLEIQVGEKYETLWEEMRAAGYVRVRIDGETHSVDEPPRIDRRRKHSVEVVIDRIQVHAESRSRIADSVEHALTVGKGVIHLAYPEQNIPEPKWRVDVHSQHYACDRCGRSFEPLAPHHFSFNSALGWCPACEGLGTQLGANPAVLVRDPKLSLSQGALALWPDVNEPLARAMVTALGAHTGMPIDKPFESLSARQRRLIMHGTGEEWIAVPLPGGKRSDAPLLRFQYKGLYPALEEASRLSTAFRARLDHLTDQVECSVCSGSRLRDDAAAVRFRDRTLDDACRLPLGELLRLFRELKLTATEQTIAGELAREVVNRVQFLVDVGLEYLTLARPAPTLSGGEAQRIRLASQVGSGLTGVLYVLDEPTIGLHPRDNRRLIEALIKLRDLGNTLLLVEHDREVIQRADELLDFGPGSGEFGGEIVAQGTAAQLAKQRNSVTGPYLSGAKAIPVPTNRRGQKPTTGKARRGASPVTSGHVDKWLEIVGARHNNLKNIHVRIPLGALTVVSGVSGSGKSSLVEDVLYNALARILHRANTMAGAHDSIRGLAALNKVIRVDQQPLGNTPTSNPATYTGVFELIRNLFAQLPEARLRGYSPRRFSFNVSGGRCEKCEGNGQLKIEMHFLPDVWVECDECRGKRYNPETLAVRYRDHSIADVLDMPCGGAVKLFANIPKIRRILQTLCDVGLDYVRLGQPAPTLSGGEAQRVKLAAELGRPDTGQTLYLLDEPTTGLHFDDLAKLLDVLNRLVDLGNTVVVIEHNLDVVKTADWVIDLGPEAGDSGGYVVVAGTPEDVIAHAKRAVRNTDQLMRSHTGEVLAPILEAGPHKPRAAYDFAAAEKEQRGDLDINDVGGEVQMPWQADGRRWHTRDRVARNGNPSRWDGEILARIVDRIQELGDFSPTNWDNRTIVEINAEKKSDGWFMHAITGEEWLLKLKFRTARRSFERESLIRSLDLKPLNEMPEIPVYGADARVTCKNLRGPWQEIQLRVHALAEVDKPAFWEFIEKSVQGFQKLTERAQTNPEDLMPWRVLGRKWHLSRKGFPPGKPIRWEQQIVEELCLLLEEAAPDAEFVWNNQLYVQCCLDGSERPWATLYTKHPAAIELVLNGPKNRFSLGRIADLAAEREVEVRNADRDQLRLKFRTLDDLQAGDLAGFVQEHAAACAEAVSG